MKKRGEKGKGTSFPFFFLSGSSGPGPSAAALTIMKTQVLDHFDLSGKLGTSAEESAAGLE